MPYLLRVVSLVFCLLCLGATWADAGESQLNGGSILFDPDKVRDFAEVRKLLDKNQTVRINPLIAGLPEDKTKPFSTFHLTAQDSASRLKTVNGMGFWKGVDRANPSLYLLPRDLPEEGWLTKETIEDLAPSTTTPVTLVVKEAGQNGKLTTSTFTTAAALQLQVKDLVNSRRHLQYLTVNSALLLTLAPPNAATLRQEVREEIQVAGADLSALIAQNAAVAKRTPAVKRLDGLWERLRVEHLNDDMSNQLILAWRSELRQLLLAASLNQNQGLLLKLFLDTTARVLGRAGLETKCLVTISTSKGVGARLRGVKTALQSQQDKWSKYGLSMGTVLVERSLYTFESRRKSAGDGTIVVTGTVRNVDCTRSTCTCVILED